MKPRVVRLVRRLQWQWVSVSSLLFYSFSQFVITDTTFFSYLFLQLVLAKTQEKAASSLTEVTWLGKKVPVKSEKLRVGFVKLQQLEGELSRAEGGDAKMDVYERLLMECQDAMQLVRDELGPEPVSKIMWVFIVHVCVSIIRILVCGYSTLHICSCTLISVPPKQNSRHDERAWFGRGLQPHQSICTHIIPTSRNISIEGLLGRHALNMLGRTLLILNPYLWPLFTSVVLVNQNQY